MKKFVSFLLAAAMLVSLSLPVLAAKPEYDAGVEDNDFGSAIKLVAVTVPDPKAGEPVSEAVVTPVPGSRFTVKYQWYEMVGMDPKPVDTETFQAGRRYRLTFEAIPNVAYWFEETTEVCYNDIYCGYQTQERRSITAYAEWDLWEFVWEIDLPKFPEAKVGDPGTFELENAECEQYTLTCQYTDPVTHLPASLVEAGKCYQLQLIAKPKPGYEFVPGMTVLQEGKPYTGMCDIGGWVTLTKFVGFGLESVADIRMEIDEPQADTPLSTTMTSLQTGITPGEFIHWYADPDGDFRNGYTGLAEVAQEGNFYYLQFYAYAENGYMLSENLNILVNGKSVPILELENYGSYCRVIVNMGRVGEVPGDVNRDGFLNTDDVVSLLLHVSMPDVFELAAPGDFTGEGTVDTDDVVKLLLHISMPDVFPLN